MMKIPRFGLAPVFFAFVAVCLSVHSMRAASGTWSATPADANWVPTGTNWSNGSALFPGATSGTTNADVATFNSASTQTGITINSTTLNFKSILFDTSAAAFTIGSTGGNSLLLTSGGSITMNAAVANTETVNAPISIQGAGGSYTIQNNATDNSKLLNIGGAITGGAAGQTTLTLNGTNTGGNTISGNISKGSATDFAIVKNGVGTWILSGTNAISNTNNFSSAVAVNAGTLNIQGATTVGAKGKITVAAGSTLDVSGAGTVAVTGGTTNTPVSISGALLLDDTGATQMTNRFSGSFTLGAGSTFGYLGNASATSTETNTGSITLGSGVSMITVAYGGSNAATVTQGGLSRSASTGGLVLINGVNLGANTGGIGSVGQFLTTASPTLVGTTTGGSTGISAGVTNTKIALFTLGESGVATGAKGSVTGIANTFLTYNAITGYRPLNPTDEFTNNAIIGGDNTYLATGTTTSSSTAAINSLVVNGGNLAITSGTLTNTSGMLLFAQNGTISGAGALILGSSSNQEGLVALNSGVNATISAILGAGTTGLTVSGSGTLTLSGANSYAGTTAVGVGSTLIIGNNSALGSSSITAVGGTIQGDGQARVITNTLIDTTSGMTIGGSSALTFTGGGTVSTPAFANSNFANSQIKMNNTGTTTFSGVFSLENQASGSNNGASILTFGSSANVVISGPIQDNNTGNVASPSTGFGSLPFTGVGANLTISGNNGYGTGKTTTIVADGAYNTVTVGGPGGAGATITPFGATTLNINTNNPLFLMAETNGQILGNNINSGGSGFALGFAGTNSITLGGTWAASAASSLTNVATGTFTFGNTISGNALTLLGSGNTTLNSSATLATGAFALTATQSGTVTLSNVNNFTGITAFSGGTVVLDYSTNNNTKLTQNSGAASAAALSLGGVNLQLSGGSFAQTLGTPSSGSNGTTLGAGQSKITQTNSGTSTLALGAITRSAGAAIDFQTGVASTTTASTSGILGGYATVGGTDWATGGGTIAALSSYDSFATPGTNKNILQSNNGSVAASTTVNSLKITTSTSGQSLAITSGQTLSLTTGGLLFIGADNYSITGGTLKPTASGGDFIVQQYGSGTLQIDSVLGNSTTSTLTKAGTGTLVLTGTNTYAGGTFVSGGVLSISADVNLGATTTSAVTLNSGTLQVTGAGFTTAHAFSLGTNGGTFQVDTGTLTSTGVISGTSYKGLSKTGAGTLLLQGTNTFLGPVTVSNGTLQLGNAAALGASSTASNRSVAPVLVNGGTLDINGQTTALGNVTLQSGAISDTTGTGTLAAYSFNLQSGTVGAKLVDLIFTGNTNSNSINLYKTTSGTVTLSGANTYSGGTTISGGKLTVASTGTINSSGGVFIGAGEFNYNSSTVLSAPVNFTGTGGKLSGIGTISSAVTITSGNTLAPGNSPGVMTFNNTLTLAGTTAMEANGTTRGTGGYDGIDTGTGLLTYGGALTITFGSTFLTGGETFDLFNIGAGGSTGDFSSVSVVGSYITSLTNSSGIWTGNTGGFDFTFTQSTGDLVIAASSVPEPATYAAIFGALALAGVVWRRRGPRA